MRQQGSPLARPWPGTPTGEFITCVRAVHSSILHMLTYLQHRVYSVCYSADGKFIASGSRDKTVKIWSVGSSGTFECESTLAGHSDWSVYYLCVRAVHSFMLHLLTDGALGLVSLLPLCSSCSCLHVALTDLSPTQCQFGLLQRRWRFACQWQR